MSDEADVPGTPGAPRAGGPTAAPRTIVFVCTANQCRSPMAEALARHAVAARLDCHDDDLETRGVRIVSAGVRAWPGVPATEDARRVAAARGLDLDAHRSQPLTVALVRDADLVLVMTEAHAAAARELAPEAADRVRLLDPAGDVEDPVGQGLAAYEACVRRLEPLIGALADEWTRDRA